MSKYIDADRLKAEINKRQKSLRAGIFGEAFTRKQKNEMLVVSEELDRFNRIIDSLQQEQPEANEVEKALSLQIQAYLTTASDELYAPGKPLYTEEHHEGIHECMKMWQKLHQYYFSTKQEQPSEDLDEAADEYSEKHGFRVPYDGSNNFYDEVDVKASKEGFIAGAKWMANQMPMPEDTVLFQKGVEEGRRLEKDDLALSIDDIEKIHVFLYAIKNNKQGMFTFTRLSDEQYKEVLRRFKEAKK